ncbi:OLC1v1010154C1 [Oldenlandia corymbosa var. corymbosa]|uniref:OLC1v1010154C1 n=1 Tax=Oldenlandia corymbosa var. corymbosa TaxID=529605 RepID=A0AAV1DQN6_OLDCO|nr:OLC1v1010154C1 [Oldenlandia corymbosa var. corymbosa]
METELAEENSKVEIAKAALHRFEEENFALRQEMVAAEAQLAGTSATLEDVFRRQKENLLKIKSLERHESIPAEARLNYHVKEKSKILLEVTRLRDEREGIEAGGNVEMAQMNLKADKEINDKEEEIEELKKQISARRLQIYFSKTAELQREAYATLLPRERECIMCLSKETYIVFLPYAHQVLGIPWDVDTEGLREYMSKFGDLEDCIVMKERSTGRSRGFGYVTFAAAEDAKSVLKTDHMLGNRMLEVKIATPKEEMRSSSRKVTRIFVARIPPSVSEAAFRSYFEQYGEITDLYMPKDPSTKSHRGIGFVTFADAGSVDDLMAETHELGGSTIVVDRATPKEDEFRPVSRMPPPPPSGGYGAYSAYISAATRYAALGAPTLYDHPGSMYGRGGPGAPPHRMGKKIFVGRLPQEASAEDLRQYFGRFGRILDVYVPKDPKRSGHRGFGFVTFAEDGVADRVSRRPHEIFGQQVAIDSATPVDDAGPSNSFIMDHHEPYAGYGGPMRAYGRMYGSMDYDDWGYGMGSGRPSRADFRYRPY